MKRAPFRPHLPSFTLPFPLEAGAVPFDLLREWHVTRLRVEVHEAALDRLTEAFLQEIAKEGFLITGYIDPANLDGTEIIIGPAPCYSEGSSRQALRSRVESAARRFQDIVVNGAVPFCGACESCRRSKPKNSSWKEYRRKRGAEVFRECVSAPARQANAEVTLRIPSGEEAPSLNLPALLPSVQGVLIGQDEEAPPELSRAFPYFTQRWLSAAAGKKARGGELTLEGTARQAVEWALAGASEIVLPPYSSWIRRESLILEQLKTEIAPLPYLAGIARKTPLRGVAAYAPITRSDRRETQPFGDALTAGLPLRPTPRFPASSRSALFTEHALADRELTSQLTEFIAQGGIAGVTAPLYGGLPQELRTAVRQSGVIWPDETDGKQDTVALQAARDRLMEPLGIRWNRPVHGVALHLFGFNDLVLHNLTDYSQEIDLEAAGKLLRIAATSDSELKDSPEPLDGPIRLGPNRWAHLVIASTFS